MSLSTIVLVARREVSLIGSAPYVLLIFLLVIPCSAHVIGLYKDIVVA